MLFEIEEWQIPRFRDNLTLEIIPCHIDDLIAGKSPAIRSTPLPKHGRSWNTLGMFNLTPMMILLENMEKWEVPHER